MQRAVAFIFPEIDDASMIDRNDIVEKLKLVYFFFLYLQFECQNLLNKSVFF